MSNPLKLKEFVKLVVETWKKYENWKYYNLAQEISNNLDDKYSRTKEEYQNILNSEVRQSIIDMMRKWFNGRYHADATVLAEQIINALEWEFGQKLY